MKKNIIKKETNIKKIVISRNPYHPNFFTKEITYTDDTITLCGGYKTLIEEVVAVICPDLDRFNDKIKDILMTYIYQDINLLDIQLKRCMKHIREKSDDGKYYEHEILKLLIDETKNNKG